MRVHALSLAVIATFAAAGPAQTAPLQSDRVPHSLRSGAHDNPSGAPLLVFEQLVSVSGAPWLRLADLRAELPGSSYLEVVALRDGHRQRLDAGALRAWRESSAYFNGDAVYVRLFAGPWTAGVSLVATAVEAGVADPEGEDSICGASDDRTASTDARVARVVPIGCTAWLIDDTNCLVSAGHCCGGGGFSTAQFNVPPSTAGGSLQHPPPQDQYPVDSASRRFANAGQGNDWCVFKTLPNSGTGQEAGQRQGAFFALTAGLPGVGTTTRITGFGTSAIGRLNQAQSTHTGPLQTAGTRLCYAVDTTGGNSGSPVIDALGRAAGVHTHGGCSVFGGCNSGTSRTLSAFATAIDDCLAGGGGGGGCAFVAAAAAARAPADSRSLGYRFRDEVMQPTPRGREYVGLYYRTSPEIVDLLRQDPLLLARAGLLLSRLLPVMRERLDFGVAALPVRDLRELDALLALLAGRGSDALHTSLSWLRADLRAPESLASLGLDVGR
ncbi:MAG: trypsin-like serine protease [Planctomycetota bacterium]